MSPYKNNNHNLFVRSFVNMTQFWIILYSSFKNQCYTILRRVFDLLGLDQWRNKVLQHDQQYKQSGRIIASSSKQLGFESSYATGTRREKNSKIEFENIDSRKVIMIFYAEFSLVMSPYKNNNHNIFCEKLWEYHPVLHHSL
jgi:hypothetical protein